MIAPLRFALVCWIAAFASGTLTAADKPPVAPPEPPPPGTWVTMPVRKPLPPEERGKRYTVPATDWKQDAVLWGYQTELADGTGFSFGGIHQLNEDGIPHTRIKEGSEWKELREELEKNNPLQKSCADTWALRNATKDLLAQVRHTYFEGKLPAEESAWLKSSIEPAYAKLVADIIAHSKTLTGAKAESYESGQHAYAAKHLTAAVEQLKPMTPSITPELLAAWRSAQLELELAAEALGAEPPPRSLSIPAYDPKTKSYVVFGGEHFDYETNDLWVFDVAQKRWFQKHPAGAPEPRADHHLDSLGDGRMALYGGYCFMPKGRYSHAGSARWIYDLTQNIWTPEGHTEKLSAPDARSVQASPPSSPESFMKGARPDAAANEALLKALPVNEVVVMKTPIPLGGRDWATWVYDPQRDMYYMYGGGHASYPGNDVARYHFATNRWEMTDPVEVPIGCSGTNEQYPAGFNYNGRPWCRNHVWNGQAYDPDLKQMVLGSATSPKIDPYFYLYNPDKGDWNGRKRFATGLNNNGYAIQMRHSKHGMFAWTGEQAWLMDSKTYEWKKLAPQGKLVASGADSSGMAYDSKRDRMLLFALGGYGRPYNGAICALDLMANSATMLTPEAPQARWDMFLREPVYLPDMDLILFASHVKFDKKFAPEYLPAYDCAKNSWVGVKIKFPPQYKHGIGGVCVSITHDPKRGLVWFGDSSWNGNVCALKLDLSKTEVTPLKDLLSAATIVDKN